MSTSFEQLQRGGSVLYGSIGGIWLMLMFDRPVVADMNLARSALRTMQQRNPSGFISLTWILPTVGFTLDADCRKAAETITKEFMSSFTGQATFIEGTGFQAAATRAIISGIDMVVRSPVPKSVFAELRPSVEWCAANLPNGRTLNVDEAVAALQAVRKPFA